MRTMLVTATGSDAKATVGEMVVADAIRASAKSAMFLMVVPFFPDPESPGATNHLVRKISFDKQRVWVMVLQNRRMRYEWQWG